MPLILKLCNCWWNGDKNITTSTWKHCMKASPCCLTWLFKKRIYLWHTLCRWDIIARILWKINDWQNKFYSAFYGSIIKHDRSFHILKIPAFLWHRKSPRQGRWQLWLSAEKRTIFDKLSDSYAQYYSPTEHLAIYEISVLFKGTVIFKQYIYI